MSNNQLINVALIGYGHLGKWHAQKVEATGDARLVAIVEPDSEKRKLAKDAHPQAKIVSQLSEVISSIDAAVIVSPTTYHCSIIEELLKSQKHILCEKPICATREELTYLRGVERKYPQLVLQVGQSERLHAAFDLLKEKDGGKIFQAPSTVVINRMAPFHPRAIDVDVISDLMIHDIDLVLYLFQEIPTHVLATGYKNRTSKWDAVTADFRFKSGKRAIIRSHRNFVKQVRDLELTSDSGIYYVDMLNNEMMMILPNSDGGVEKIHYEKRDHLFIEHKSFYRSILKKESPIVSFTEGLNAFQLVLITEESLKFGGWTQIEMN